MLCTLVLHERVFVCKIPVAIPGWSRGGENVVQDGRGRSGVACGKVAGNSYSWRWTKGKYTFVYMKNNEDKSTDRQKQSSRRAGNRTGGVCVLKNGGCKPWARFPTVITSEGGQNEKESCFRAEREGER